MTDNAKKELVLCDYCQLEKDGSQIYTTRKNFAGLKIVDILETMSQLSVSTVKLINTLA